MISNIRMMRGNAGSENAASSPRQIYAFPSENHAAARRSRADSRITRNRFPQNQRRSRSYRASFFLYDRAR